MLNYLENQTHGRDEIPVPGLPIKFAGADDPDVVPAPLLGEHTDEVLAELLGYDEERIAALREQDAL
jgi:crotonobetainyl-CoA:carnitine CoA-transferase CaiB-like acyl-CoA transferase